MTNAVLQLLMPAVALEEKRALVASTSPRMGCSTSSQDQHTSGPRWAKYDRPSADEHQEKARLNGIA